MYPAFKLLMLGAVLAAQPVEAFPDSAARLYRQARKAEKRGDYRDAYALSSRAVALDPDRPEYWNYSQAVRTRALAGLYPGVAAADSPAAAGSTISAEDLRQSRRALPPPALMGAAGRRSFDIRADAKALFEQVSKAFGLDVVFDSDYTAGAPIGFRLDDATWQEALHAAETVTGSFLIPLGQHLAMVAKDSSQKRAQLEPVMNVLIPLPPPLSPQDVQEAVRAVQSTLDLTKTGIDTGRRVVLFRDRVSKLRPALALFDQILAHRAQIVAEVELLAFTETSTLNLGLVLQSSYPVAFASNPTPFAYQLTLDPSRMLAFGGGNTTLAVTVSDANLFASLVQGRSQSLLRAELRSLDGQAAQLHVGDRFPILTSGFFGRIEGEGQVFTPPPTIHFEDLGVVLKVTPHVHGVESVTLELEAEFKSLSGQALNGIPVISNRKFATQFRATFGQTAIIAGLTRQSLSQSWSGIPLLSLIPGLRSNDRSAERMQLLLTLRPRLVNLPPSEIPTFPIYTGSEMRPLTALE